MKQYPLSNVKAGDTLFFAPYQRKKDNPKNFIVIVDRVSNDFIRFSRDSFDDIIDRRENTHLPCSVIKSYGATVYRSESHYQEYWEHITQQRELRKEIQKLLSDSTPISILIEVRDLLKKKEGLNNA